MSKAVFYQKGDSIDFRNSGDATIEANTIIKLGSRIAIAGTSIKPGELGSVNVVGIYQMPKASGAIDAGAVVYWDASANKITTTSEGNTVAGYAVEAAASADTLAVVKINA